MISFFQKLLTKRVYNVEVIIETENNPLTKCTIAFSAYSARLAKKTALKQLKISIGQVNIQKK